MSLCLDLLHAAHLSWCFIAFTHTGSRYATTSALPQAICPYDD